MTLRQLLAVLALYGLALGASVIAIVSVLSLDRQRTARGPYLVSVWRQGERVARTVVPDRVRLATALREASSEPGAQRVVDTVVDSAPMVGRSSVLLGLGVAPNRDGVSATLHGVTAYATPDDLRKLEAYEKTLKLGPVSLLVGVDAERLLARLAAELHVSVSELRRGAEFRRFAVESDAGYPRALPADALSQAALRESVLAAARYLLHSSRSDGSFRYEINAVTGADEPGYAFPRHAGAAYFLARAGNQLGDAPLRAAARRTAKFLADSITLRCGQYACIGQGERADVGSAALALLSYVELVEGGADEFREPALALAAFLRSQQRSDGDFRHFYDVAQQRAIDEQVEYYTGEAALALSRVHRLSGDARDLDAARRALAFLTTRSAWFVTARYFWGAEHWTCQVLDDLWQRAPDPKALRFCLDWQAATRELQLESPPAAPEYDGALSRGPFVVPRVTQLASRMEAAVATLAVARRADVPAAEVERLEREIQRALSFLLRYQLVPGPARLMPDPSALVGGFPGSPIDLHVRIDYPQHAGGALLRYWELRAAVAAH